MRLARSTTLTALALALLAAPFRAEAQRPPGTTPRIGVLAWWSAGSAVAERVLGLTIPPSVFAQADEVIQ